MVTFRVPDRPSKGRSHWFKAASICAAGSSLMDLLQVGRYIVTSEDIPRPGKDAKTIGQDVLSVQIAMSEEVPEAVIIVTSSRFLEALRAQVAPSWSSQQRQQAILVQVSVTAIRNCNRTIQDCLLSTARETDRSTPDGAYCRRLTIRKLFAVIQPATTVLVPSAVAVMPTDTPLGRATVISWLALERVLSRTDDLHSHFQSPDSTEYTMLSTAHMPGSAVEACRAESVAKLWFLPPHPGRTPPLQNGASQCSKKRVTTPKSSLTKSNSKRTRDLLPPLGSTRHIFHL